MRPPDHSGLSPADLAFARFTRFRSEARFLRRSDEEFSESDTRSKFIDPLLKEVLGWREVDIRRETAAAEGWVDYGIGADFVHFHIEAKRALPRFDLRVPSRARILKLSGPHLLGNRDIRAHLEQAARYAGDLGSDFTLVTNGDQLILYRTRLRGRSWRDGSAIVWHDYDDLQGDFARFYGILSRDAVHAGALREAFESAAGVTTPLYSPLSFIHNPDATLVRNPFWDRIARAVTPLMTDAPTDAAVQEEILRECYVRTPLSDEADANINRLLQDRMPAFLQKARTQDLVPGMQGRTAFDLHVENDVKAARCQTYLLTGGVGSGKTTFLRRFARIVGASFVREWCVWLHVDYLQIGSVTEADLEDELQRYTYATLRRLLTDDYPEMAPKDGAGIRELFASEIEHARTTLLYGMPEDSPEWNAKVNEIVYRAHGQDPWFVQAVLSGAARRSRRVVVVLDNTDQLGERFQEAVFLLSQRLARDCSALTIVALREEKFFAAYRRGTFDAYGDRRFHIGSPSLESVIEKRLRYAIQRYRRLRREESLLGEPPSDEADAEVERVLGAFVRSTTQRNHNIVRLLACVSNGDMRHALGMFREFVSSGNTDIEKILRILRDRGGYTVPFHEFAKSAILGSRRYFRSGTSHIMNVFSRSPVQGASHLTACRLLARLTAAAAAPSPHAEGFVDTPLLLSEYRASFGLANDLIARAEELLRRGLIETEPPRATALDETDAVRVAASGAYYWRYLARSFAYLDLVLVDTPIADRSLAEKLANWAPICNMSVRFERVRAFLDYLAAQEAEDLGAISTDGGPYSQALVPEIRDQLEREIRFIRKKTHAEDLQA